jgi:hypothetical protein
MAGAIAKQNVEPIVRGLGDRDDVAAKVMSRENPTADPVGEVNVDSHQSIEHMLGDALFFIFRGSVFL